MPNALSAIRRLGQFLLLTCLLGLLLGGSSGERVIIPIEIDQYNRLIVELTLNGSVTTEGVVDTAATLPMINNATARAAGVEGVDGEHLRLVTVLGLGGPEVFPLIDVAHLSAGNVHLTMQPAALDRKETVKGVKNVFPVSVLEGDVLDFDFEMGHVSAYDARPHGRNRDILSRVPLRVQDGLFFIDVTINGVKGRALIDTGSSITYVNSSFAEKSGMNTNSKKTEQLLGITGNEYDVRIARIKRVDLGRLRLERLDLLVSDPRLFEYLGIAEEPVMVIGMDFLSSFRVQIDRKREKFYLRNRRDSDKENCLICSGVNHYPTRLD